MFILVTGAVIASCRSFVKNVANLEKELKHVDWYSGQREVVHSGVWFSTISEACSEY